MAGLLFLDDSGKDRKVSPYEVLAGVAVRDSALWNLIRAIQQLEVEHFGRRYTDGTREIKAKRLLDRRTYIQAGLIGEESVRAFDLEERRTLSRECLDHGAAATPTHIAALAQAKLAFTQEVLVLCSQHKCRAFASIVSQDAPRPTADVLRKDYSYLLQRFFHFLEDQPEADLGLVVFDELERIQSHILLQQMSRYFQETHNGRTRAARIVPEPFFVHSHLTTMIQVADLVAYVLSWGFRLSGMVEPRRTELAPWVELVCVLRYRSRQTVGLEDRWIWSFSYIDDLRPWTERAAPPASVRSSAAAEVVDE